MRFKSLDLTEKKWLLAFLLCLFCWWLFSASATASASGTQEAMYQITESELTMLENNLAQLRSINERLQRELTAQKQELHVLREESGVLVKQLNELKSLSVTQENSLMKANKLLEEYAIEEKNKRLKIKAQRNIWAAVATCLVVALAVK